MKQLDLTSATPKKIINASIELFNEHGYFATSISDIAKRAELSKGILYHYFSNKDELYIYCIKECVKEYAMHMQAQYIITGNCEEDVIEYIKQGYAFLNKKPEFRNLFLYLLSENPAHLADKLTDLRLTFKQENQNIFLQILKTLQLGNGVSEKDIYAFIYFMQKIISTAFIANKTKNDIQVTQENLLRIVTIFLNGLKNDIE